MKVKLVNRNNVVIGECGGFDYVTIDAIREIIECHYVDHPEASYIINLFNMPYGTIIFE